MNLRSWSLRARALFARRHVERELDEELAFHIDREARNSSTRACRRPMPASRRGARFGSVPGLPTSVETRGASRHRQHRARHAVCAARLCACAARRPHHHRDGRPRARAGRRGLHVPQHVPVPCRSRAGHPRDVRRGTRANGRRPIAAVHAEPVRRAGSRHQGFRGGLRGVRRPRQPCRRPDDDGVARHRQLLPGPRCPRRDRPCRSRRATTSRWRDDR